MACVRRAGEKEVVSMANDTEKRALAKRKAGLLSRQAKELTVGALERALLKEFPAEDAEAWDRTGLLVGDAASPVEGVAVALDPTVEAIREAKEAGANVLVTHHPAFLEPPTSFAPLATGRDYAGSVVWEAVSRGVALMAFHTTLDASAAGGSVLPGMLGLDAKAPLQPAEGSRGVGIGRVCSVRRADAPLSLAHLAARCTSVFGRPPRVWGDFSRELDVVVVCSGSAGSVVDDALAVRADCLVCGELSYHKALAASERGLAVIELGHDVSELPYVATLMAAVERAGVAKAAIAAIDQGGNWTHPESMRV